MVAGLACLYARSSDERTAYFKVLPVALAVALLSFAVLPESEVTWPPLQERAEKVRKLFTDYFMFTNARTGYSLNLDGYMPMGNRLGGPSTPNEQAVMEVESSRDLLLRGSIRRVYTGYSWTDNAVNSRFLFGDFMKRATRDAIFDVGRAAEVSATDMFPPVDARVVMLSEATSTIFIPHRLTELSTALDLPSYYNSSGEAFTTRGLSPGDTYSLSAEVPILDSRRMAEVLSRAAQVEDSNYSQILANYSAIPRGVEQGVYDLTNSIIQGASSPFEAAVRLQNHLLSNYAYTLNVPYPPDQRDFVSYFLLEEKKGYCTYFASTMAIMGRIAGLPTRYIEGYAVPAGNGAQVVTGEYAHAWVEVYFSGIGWLSFNPTPGQGDMGNERTSGGAAGGQDTEEDPQTGETDETPPDEQTQEPETGETEDPENTEMGSTTNEEDIPPEDDSSGEEDMSQEFGGQRARRLWLWLIFALALGTVGGGIFIRLRRSNPIFRALEFESMDDRLIVWYKGILLLYEQLGQVPEPSESPALFVHRMLDQGMATEAFAFVTDRLTISRYAKDAEIEGATFRQAKVAYDQLKAQLKFFDRLNWYKVRIIKGLGDFTRVP